MPIPASPSTSTALPRPANTRWRTSSNAASSRERPTNLGDEIRRTVTAYKSFFLKHYSYSLHLVQNFVSCPSTFIRSGAFDRVGLLDERFTYSMDYDLWLRLGRLSPPVILDQTSPAPGYRLFVRRSFARWLCDWLIDAAEEFRFSP